MDLVSDDTLHIHAYFFTLSDFEAVGWTFTSVHEQILYFLVVDLEHAERDLKLFLAFYFVPLNSLEYFLASHGYDTTIGFIADHGVGLACTSLTIRKKTAVKAIPTR